MPLRLFTVLVAALALLPAAARAQEPTSTPGPPNSASDAVKLIYEDYRRDGGQIDLCAHDRADLEDAMDTIKPAFDRDFPDFREALEIGIQRHDDGRCDEDEEAEPTATAEPTSTAESGELPLPQDESTDDTGVLPLPEDGSLPDDQGGAPEEQFGDVTPAPTPAPTTAPPAVAPVVPAAPAVSPTPAIVTTSADSGSLVLPIILIGLALLGAAALVASAVAARRNPQLDHAWREFGLRTRETWSDFTDWLRLGR